MTRWTALPLGILLVAGLPLSLSSPALAGVPKVIVCEYFGHWN